MKTALITGASGGIGYELAKQFARHQHNLVLVARSEAKLNQLADEIRSAYNVQVLVLAQDLGQPQAVSKIQARLQAENITVEYLVNNAGFGDFGFFVETDWAKEEQMINLNIMALTHFTKVFTQQMVQRRSGRILNVASTAAFQAGPLMAVYFATKAYVLSFSEAIANELQGTGVTVTALCPGPTESGFLQAAALEESKLFKGKKLASSAEVAAYGYQALMAGKTVAIHGTRNWLLANTSRFIPRKLAAAFVRRNVQAE
ncbi:SDR family NAD(P)-dependent oxidoreductase [Adhaeribacter pallidiroseus]|uniref:Very-long-chain 3-oxoacyl-CoA reductase-A n=1 Tax=Adhaeribacter pallidiroseus TaxID=2072847 RepID=A0A369QM29_9BACT|nr:SDR family oxidoreductase [Adhaeribacter pallidiroseus]RDC64715.1 Very-long-chain 3-oxoacyl-CoA reductase-A [Adhaeribacter pallidiroseus]